MLSPREGDCCWLIVAEDPAGAGTEETIRLGVTEGNSTFVLRGTPT